MKFLYVLHGQIKVTFPGQPPVRMLEGGAVFVPAGQMHSIEAIGGRTAIDVLVAFGPAGPEQSYRDPKNRAGTIVGAAPIAKADAPPITAELAKVKALSFATGKGSAKILFDKENAKTQEMALGWLSFAAGAELPEHQHEGSSELLYVLSGSGKAVINGERIQFEAGTVLHIPADVAHSLKVDGNGPVVAIQLHAPGGPEQRFKTAETTSQTPSKEAISSSGAQ